MKYTLAIRTDKPEAELYLLKESRLVSEFRWEAHRKLAETLHRTIKEFLEKNDCSLSDLKSILIYSGPGSFTGLRIGISVANALAYSLGVPIYGESGEDWLQKTNSKVDSQYVTPFYGSEPHITKPKK